MASVVLVHGIRTSGTMWRAQSRMLERAGVPHLAVDLPGYGSRIGEPFTLARCRQTLDAAVASLQPPHVVVGLSLGSYVAIDWAARTAVAPEAIVLASCGTQPRGIGLSGYIVVAGLIARLPDKGLGLHTWAAQRVVDAELAADLLDGGVGLDAVVPTLQELAGLDVRGALTRIECPIWFVNGQRDHFRVEERRMLRATRAGTLVVVPDAGHLVALDQPAAFADLVAAVVDEVDVITRSRPRG